MVEHNHLLVVADIAAPAFREDEIESWMNRLISDLGMIALIPPKAVYCDTIGNRGMTCICAVETSHIVVHFWDEGAGSMQLDVYTCSKLDLDVVWKAVEQFRPTNLKYKFYDRQNGFLLVDESE